MKRLKLITKFFFQQKCSEIWEKIKRIPQGLLNCIKLLGVGMAIIIPLFAIAVTVGYVCIKFLHFPYNHRDSIYSAYLGSGFLTLLGCIIIASIVHAFIVWIKENIDIASERANAELGLTNTTFVTNKEVDKNYLKIRL